MEIHFQLNYKMPKEVIQAFHITEDTAFETYFENGMLYIRALSEEENQPASPEECDGNCESCAFSECCPYEKAEPEACSVKSPQFEHDSDDGDELTEDDLYCPLKVMRYEYDKYGNLDYGSNTAEDLRTDMKDGSGSVWRDISKTMKWQNTLMAAGVRPKS